MNILVATDGVLDPQRTAEAVSRWYQDGDSVTVFTAMSIPTEFLRRLGSSGVKEAALIAHEAGQTLGAGDRAAERLVRSMPTKEWAKVDSPVLSALGNAAHARTKPIVDALRARGIEARGIWRTTENKTAHTTIQTIKELDAELLVIGSHGGGRFEGRLGSTGSKLVRHAPVSVLVIREE